MPSKRPSRTFFHSPGRGRKDSRPNVFVQSDKPSESERAPSGEPVAAAGNGQMAHQAAAGSAVVTARRRGLRGRTARPRSEVYTRTLGKELRQIIVLSVVSVGVIVALAFVLQ